MIAAIDTQAIFGKIGLNDNSNMVAWSLNGLRPLAQGSFLLANEINEQDPEITPEWCSERNEKPGVVQGDGHLVAAGEESEVVQGDSHLLAARDEQEVVQSESHLLAGQDVGHGSESHCWL